MNVALSRVRKCLYFITNKNEFQLASTDTNWESYWIAKDLLQLSKNDNVDNCNIRLRSPRSIYDSFLEDNYGYF
jgi:hypothetical protein